MWSDSRRDFLCKEMESSGISQPVKLTNVNMPISPGMGNCTQWPLGAHIVHVFLEAWPSRYKVRSQLWNMGQRG